MEYNFCPNCARPLIEREIFHANRKVCPDRENCGFVLFLEPKLVAVVLIEHNRQLLLGKRNMNPAKGLWSFPGGYVDRFERVEDAALREVKEETNLEVALEELLGVYSEKGNPVVLLVYQASLISGLEVMQAQPEEVSELRFFDPDNFPEMAFSSEVAIMRDWRARQVSSQALILDFKGKNVPE